MGQRPVEQPLPMPRPWQTGADGVRRQDPGALAPDARREADHRGGVVGHPAAARVGVEEVPGAPDPARPVVVGARLGLGLVATEPAGRARGTPSSESRSAAGTSSGRIGRRSHLGHAATVVSPAPQDGCHADPRGPRQVRRHPHRRRGRRRDRRPAGGDTRPTTRSTWRPWPTAAPGFVDVMHAALGGELHVVTVEAGPRRGGAGDRAARRRHGLRRERPVVRPAPDARGRRRARDHDGASASWCSPRSTAAPRGRGGARRSRHQRRRSGLPGRARRHVRRHPRLRSGLLRPAVPTVDLAPAASGSPASSSSWPATSTSR